MAPIQGKIDPDLRNKIKAKGKEGIQSWKINLAIKWLLKCRLITCKTESVHVRGAESILLSSFKNLSN